MRGTPWTPELIARAVALEAAGTTAAEIDRLLGRVRGATRNMLNRLRETPEERARRLARMRNARCRKKRRPNDLMADGPILHPPGSFALVRIPPFVLAERERVHAAPRTPSMIVLGDPLPGRSALDRRLSR